MSLPLPDPDDEDEFEQAEEADIISLTGGPVRLTKSSVAPVDEDDEDVFDAEIVAETTTELAVPAPTEVEPWSPRTAVHRRFGEIAERSILPPAAHVRASSLWWMRTIGRDAAWFALHPWAPVGAEMNPISRGVRVTWDAWREWVTVARMARVEESVPKDAAGRTSLAKEAETQASRRRKLSAFLAILAVAGLVVGYFWYRQYVIAAAVLAVVGADIIGRRNPDPDDGPPIKRRTMLEEGAPLGSLAATVIERLNEDGVRADAAGRMTVHPGGEYRLDITHEDAIEPKHLRSLERAVNAMNGTVRCISSGVGGLSQLRMPTRDHLAVMAPREFADTGSRSIIDAANLWGRADGDPSSPRLSAVHIDMVGTTGAGKSEAVQEFISFFGECSDVYPVFIDLTRGPLGPLNKRVLRRTAYSMEEALTLLEWALAKVEERHLVLHRLAESDDDDAPIEWDLSWGPEIKIIIDEYSFVAIVEELHGLVEQIMRVGRKVKITVLRASQRSGVKDLGSTVAEALVGLKILLACTERDTTSMLSTGHRDQGWSPHLLRPAVKGDARDAGKCYVWGPGHRDPDIHRFHQPRPPGEIKRIDRRREADGLPNLDGTPPGERRAVVLTDRQVAAEAVFTDRGATWLPTRIILEELEERGFDIDSGALGDDLGNCGSRMQWEEKLARGYGLDDIHRAWGVLDE